MDLSAKSGGAIFVKSYVNLNFEISNSVFLNNSATASGGAVLTNQIGKIYGESQA